MIALQFVEKVSRFLPEVLTHLLSATKEYTMCAVSTSKAPAAIGPYSQGIDTDSLIFTSGQLGLDPVDGTLAEGPAAQMAQAMKNVRAILEEGGSGMEKIVKALIFLQDMEHFSVINEVYSGFFSGSFPARSCVQVARLPKDALVEIEVIALK